MINIKLTYKYNNLQEENPNFNEIYTLVTFKYWLNPIYLERLKYTFSQAILFKVKIIPNLLKQIIENNTKKT